MSYSVESSKQPTVKIWSS